MVTYRVRRQKDGRRQSETDFTLAGFVGTRRYFLHMVPARARPQLIRQLVHAVDRADERLHHMAQEK